MTTAVIPSPFGTVAPTASNRFVSNVNGIVGAFRLPTDPLYYATMTLQNVVSGSRYRVTRNDTGAELTTGTGGGADIVLSGLPAYANPMLCNISVRNASGATKYKPVSTAAYLYKTGGSSYIVQVVD